MTIGNLLGLLRLLWILRRLPYPEIKWFLTSPNYSLGNRTPWEEIEEGHVERALNVARMWSS